MKIPHLSQPQQSRFYPQVIGAIAARGRQFPIRLRLNATRAGYKGCYTVTIAAADELEFEANAEFTDWTRFPARIRAAATAMRDANCLGLSTITHCEGELLIDHPGQA